MKHENIGIVPLAQSLGPCSAGDCLWRWLQEWVLRGLGCHIWHQPRRSEKCPVTPASLNNPCHICHPWMNWTSLQSTCNLVSTSSYVNRFQKYIRFPLLKDHPPFIHSKLSTLQYLEFVFVQKAQLILPTPWRPDFIWTHPFLSKRKILSFEIEFVRLSLLPLLPQSVQLCVWI